MRSVATILENRLYDVRLITLNESMLRERLCAHKGEKTCIPHYFTTRLLHNFGSLHGHDIRDGTAYQLAKNFRKHA